jgi:hypothetical protein
MGVQLHLNPVFRLFTSERRKGGKSVVRKNSASSKDAKFKGKIPEKIFLCLKMLEFSWLCVCEKERKSV